VKFFLDNWFLFFTAIVSGSLLLWPMLTRGTSGGRITPAQAVQLINREKAVLIDVSEPAEFAAGHAAGAKNVPIGALEDPKAGLPTNKTLPLVLLCPSGAHAGRAATLLRKAGYEKAVAMAGGTAAWRDAQFPIEKAEKSA